ncbi:MAG TPA: aspartate aminotransferase family protein [Candidatus Saccharimonadales bacterium]|nr:aspartate aminotransferase family protein [Candidatus Saccharimonadales bacterium]
MTEEEFDQYVLPVYQRFPITIVEAEGSYIYDDNGKKYLDFLSGWSVSNLGHRPRPVVDAIKEQADKLIHVPNVFYQEPQGELAKLLVENSIKGKVFFGNSGAEANEAAIKFAKLYGGGQRHKIITTERSFHGRTSATMAATGQDRIKEGFAPHLPGFVHVRFNDIEALRSAVDDDTIAIMLEPVQGEGGIHIATPEYAAAIQQICREKDILLIVDEVQSGMGRTGPLFAYQGYDLRPDIITSAKSLASGLPIGATILGTKVAANVRPGMHGSTFGGGALVASAAIATLQMLLSAEVKENTAMLSGLFAEKLAELEKKHGCIQETRQRGLMIGIELDQDSRPVAQACLDEGLFINSTQHTVIRLLPPLTATTEEVEQAVSILDGALAAL